MQLNYSLWLPQYHCESHSATVTIGGCCRSTEMLARAWTVTGPVSDSTGRMISLRAYGNYKKKTEVMEERAVCVSSRSAPLACSTIALEKFMLRDLAGH